MSLPAFAISASRKQDINALYSILKQTNWFEQGSDKAPHQIYVFAEPNCMACHMLYENVLPVVKSGKLQIRWIMVAILKPSSVGKSAAIINAKHPSQALSYNESHFSLLLESGGIKPLTSNAVALAQVRFNTNVFIKLDLEGTPVIIFKTSDGDMQVIQGTPVDFKALLAKIGRY